MLLTINALKSTLEMKQYHHSTPCRTSCEKGFCEKLDEAIVLILISGSGGYVAVLQTFLTLHRTEEKIQISLLLLIVVMNNSNL